MKAPEELKDLPKISRRQVFFNGTCKWLAKDEHEEFTEDLFGARKMLYNFFSKIRYMEAQRLRKKYGTTSFRPRRLKKGMIYETKDRKLKII